MVPKPCDHPEWSHEGGINYVEVINRSLPLSIRCSGISFVAEDFDARFAARARMYRYFLPVGAVGGLSATDLQELAQVFVGEHDFRNFC